MWVFYIFFNIWKMFGEIETLRITKYSNLFINFPQSGLEIHLSNKSISNFQTNEVPCIKENTHYTSVKVMKIVNDGDSFHRFFYRTFYPWISLNTFKYKIIPFQGFELCRIKYFHWKHMLLTTIYFFKNSYITIMFCTNILIVVFVLQKLDDRYFVIK